MQSGFSMTEPDSPGSDPRSLKTTARRDGDEWVINGHKWFTSNGKDADFFIVMCRTGGQSEGSNDTGRMTQIIVPTNTPGVNIVRGIGIWGRSTSDHCEIIYENVRVPVANQLGATGSGHQAAAASVATTASTAAVRTCFRICMAYSRTFRTPIRSS
jgi:acyl-CoA dehydrogenase